MTGKETPSVRQRIQYRKLSDGPPPERVFASLYRDSSSAAWLDSSDVRAGFSRFSFIADTSHPSDYVIRYHSRSRTLELVGKSESETRKQSIFDFLKTALAAAPSASAELPLPFVGGFIGYFGYELKGECDGQYRHESGLPDAYLLRVSRFLAFDHETGDCYVVTTADDESWVDETLDSLRDIGRGELELHSEFHASPGAMPDLNFEKSRDEYLRAVRNALREIQQGETYQVCLTDRAHCRFDGDAFDLYRILRRQNPAPFSAFLKCGHFAVLSSSPERFLNIDPSGHIESRPIKGTSARSPDPEMDATLSQALLASEKDRAENVMITDLVRNDLGRVARVGSVRVPSLVALETYATVHHLVSTVQAQLRTDLSPIDCIQAAFPGGSMTGAPKIRTMEIIDDLESSARGVYSGALGYISYDGATDLSIVIRTLIVSPGSIGIGTGGGVVAASDPQAEYEEAMLKADTVIAAVRKFHADARKA